MVIWWFGEKQPPIPLSHARKSRLTHQTSQNLSYHFITIFLDPIADKLNTIKSLIQIIIVQSRRVFFLDISCPDPKKSKKVQDLLHALDINLI
jgi:hypothetical protein